MDTKMHLGAKVPNEGARRLAWWVARSAASSTLVASIQLGVTRGTLDRLLRGELIPGEELVRPITIATGGEITRVDWRRPADGGWFDMPAARRLARAA